MPILTFTFLRYVFYVDKSVISVIFGNCHFRPRIVRFWPQGVTLTLNRTSPLLCLPEGEVLFRVRVTDNNYGIKPFKC